MVSTPSRCSSMITSFPSSPAPSSMTLVADGESGVPMRVMPDSGPQPRLREIRHRFGRDVELAVKALGGGAGAEAVHADEAAVLADEPLPALAHARLDGDAHRRSADRLQP